MTTNYDDKGPINLVCPRCGNMIPNNETPGAYPGAMSRWTAGDHRNIEICSACGTNEAMIQFSSMGEDRDPVKAVHPILGDVMWVNPPEDAL